MEPSTKGKTLWEMLMDRLHHRGTSNGSGIPFSNPLDLRVGSAIAVAHSNGPEFANYDFSVQEIREYTRRITEQEFRFTDYVLRGVNQKSFDANEALTARLRAVPNSCFQILHTTTRRGSGSRVNFRMITLISAVRSPPWVIKLKCIRRPITVWS